jgi:hypothetical protein
LFPEKFVPFSHSTLSHFARVLAAVEKPIPVAELFANTSKQFSGPSEFMYTIDALYVLGALDIDLNTRMVRRAH